MDEDIDIDILSHFHRVPHKGLSRIVETLDVLGIATVDRKWKSAGDEHYPRIEYLLESPYTLSMGVTRQPFVGHTSWISIHAANEDHERTSTLLLMYREADRIWLRSWSRGMCPDARIDALVAQWFPRGESQVQLDQDGLINATAQHLANILLDG
ncbi:hypothetical protein K8R04_03565 [Candidatus Uhrbacteria bacterium]|nr:hypothetical protein [Candidatus Uhrbacteria bacterium]